MLGCARHGEDPELLLAAGKLGRKERDRDNSSMAEYLVRCTRTAVERRERHYRFDAASQSAVDLSSFQGSTSISPWMTCAGVNNGTEAKVCSPL